MARLADLLDGMGPGEWMIDDSRHQYKCGGIPIRGYEWHARSMAGTLRRGVAREYEAGRARAEAWARSSNVA